MSFWSSIDKQTNTTNSSNGFNIQQFMKFYNENKGKDMNKALQDMISSGQVTQEQVNNATNKAKNIMTMLQGLGMFK